MSRETEYGNVSSCRFRAGRLTVRLVEDDNKREASSSSSSLWRNACDDDDDDNDDDDNSHRDGGGSRAGVSLFCSRSFPAESTVRIRPMDRIGRGGGNGSGGGGGSHKRAPVKWRPDSHFHEDFCLPARYHHGTEEAKDGDDNEKGKGIADDDGGDNGGGGDGGSGRKGTAGRGGVTVLLEGMARECLAVALSPAAGFRTGRTYEVTFGGNGNTVTTVERKSSARGEGLIASYPGRVCRSHAWTDYWVCYCSGTLYAGVGPVPGERCVAILDDLAGRDSPPSAEELPRYVGVGNSSAGDRQAPGSLKVRNLRVTTVPDALCGKLRDVKTGDLEVVLFVDQGGGAGGEDRQAAADDDKTHKILKDYRDQCVKAKRRAEKFGVPYQGPPLPAAFFPWSEARRLQANPTPGFITGIDVADPAERAKQEARRARFGIPNESTGTASSAADEGKDGAGTDAEGSKREGGGGGNDDDDDDADAEMAQDENDDSAAVLPLRQAWDNEALVRPHRTDPPSALWVCPPDQRDDDEREGKDEFAMERDEPATVPEKVHVFSIDWAAFKQIRTEDIMSHFSSYGPTYVEWLGDLGCNVQFEDRFSAKRALENMSTELPTPPPEGVSRNPIDGDEYNKDQSEKQDNNKEEEKQREEQTEGKSNGNSDNGEDRGDSNNGDSGGDREDGNGDSDNGNGNGNGNEAEEDSPSDLGRMGWRLGKKAIKKIKNDRHGRRGTTARVLLRVATTLDVLHERPSAWPKPPPGFTTQRVLGPGSDFPADHQRQRQRQRRRRQRGRRRSSEPQQLQQQQQQQQQASSSPGGRKRRRHRRRSSGSGGNERGKESTAAAGPPAPPPRRTVSESELLSGGLRAGRAGFSVEEMEAERARKRAKVEDK